MIHQVECLEPKLKLQTLEQSNRLLRRKIEIRESRTTQKSACRIAENFLFCRLSERRQIPPVQNVVWSAVGIHAVHDIAVILLEIDMVHRGVAPGEARGREASAEYNNSADLPAA